MKHIATIVFGALATLATGSKLFPRIRSSELAVEFTDLMINDVLVPIATGGLSAQTGGEAGRTLGGLARQLRGAHRRPSRCRCVDTTLSVPLTITAP